MHRSLTILLLSLVLNASAATYYVDYVGGSDASAGTSTGTAFQRCPGDYRATGTSASTTLAAGDTVIFKGGVEYDVTRTNENCIALTWNGSSGNPITYDGNSAGTWGTGKPVFTDNHHYYGTSGIGASAFGSSSSKSHLVFRNLSFFEIGGSATAPVDPGVATNRNTGAGINLAGGATTVYVTDCDFAELGYYWSVKPMNSSSVSGIGIQVINYDGFTVTNCDFTRVAIALELAADNWATNLTVISNSFHNSIVWCLDIVPLDTSVYLGAINVSGNTFYNFGEFGDGTWTGYDEWPHVDGIFHRCDFQGPQYSTNYGATGINFFGNSFYDTNQISANGTACMYLAGGTSAIIYSNTFIHTLKSRTIFIASPRTSPTTWATVRIHNNTFVEDYQTAIEVSPGGSVSASVVEIRDNVFYDVREGLSANRILYFSGALPASNLVVNHNLYSTRNTAGSFFQWDTVGTGGIATMQAQGLEANGFTNNPVFVNIGYGSGYQCNLNDLHLQSSSPAIGAASDAGDQGAFPYSAGGGGSTFTRSYRTGKQVSSGKVVRQ